MAPPAAGAGSSAEGGRATPTAKAHQEVESAIAAHMDDNLEPLHGLPLGITDPNFFGGREKKSTAEFVRDLLRGVNITFSTSASSDFPVAKAVQIVSDSDANFCFPSNRSNERIAAEAQNQRYPLAPYSDEEPQKLGGRGFLVVLYGSEVTIKIAPRQCRTTREQAQEQLGISYYQISSFYDVCVKTKTRAGEGVLPMKLHGLIIIVETGGSYTRVPSSANVVKVIVKGIFVNHVLYQQVVLDVIEGTVPTRTGCMAFLENVRKHDPEPLALLPYHFERMLTKDLPGDADASAHRLPQLVSFAPFDLHGICRRVFQQGDEAYG